MERKASPTIPPDSSSTPAEPKIPRVRVLQDTDAEPVRVRVMEESKQASVGVFAVVIFLSSLLGTLIGLGADFGDFLGSISQVQNIINPPPTLCVAGSNTILGEGLALAQDWEAAFEAQHRVNVQIRGIGSTAGVAEAAEGNCVHILAMSEPMTDAQYDRLMGSPQGIEMVCAAEIGFDVLAFITNLNNPMVRDVRDPNDPTDRRPLDRPVNIRDLRSILVGEVRDWAELGNWPPNTGSLPITILLRIRSGTSELVMNRLANFTQQPIPQQLNERYEENGDMTGIVNWAPGNLYPAGVNYVLCKDNADCLSRALDIPGSLYWVAEAWLRTQPENYLAALSILEGDERPVNPLEVDVDLELYPRLLIRPLYFYVLDSASINDETETLARDFLNYVRSIPGQSLLDSYSFYNHFSRPIDIEVPFPESVFEIPDPGAGQRIICKP